jgi:hypothetical protein
LIFLLELCNRITADNIGKLGAEEVRPVEVVFVIEGESFTSTPRGIVARASTRVGQNSVCESDFLEPGMGSFLISLGSLVCDDLAVFRNRNMYCAVTWMVFQSSFPVSGLDLFGGCIFVKLKDPIRVD